MFYAVLALLATKSIGTSKHSAIIAAFDREFVKTGVFARGLSKSLHLAFDRRQTHDYGEMIQIDRQITDEALANARTFVSQVEACLHESGSSNLNAEE